MVLVVAPPVQAFPKALWPSRDARVESLCGLYSYIDIRVMSQDEGRGMCVGRGRDKNIGIDGNHLRSIPEKKFI